MTTSPGESCERCGCDVSRLRRGTPCPGCGCLARRMPRGKGEVVGRTWTPKDTG